MNICIFETEHFEIIESVVLLFDTDSNKITVIINDDMQKHFTKTFRKNMSKYNWVVINESKSRAVFFRSLYKALKKNKPDILYLNTISNNHLLFASVISLIPKTRTILTVHDINCLFDSKPGFSIRSIVRHLGKIFLIKKINEFNVLSPTMTSYLQKKVNNRKKIHTIPGAIFNGLKSDLIINDHIRLVVPGCIDKKRRDYDQVFELIKLAEEQKIPLHITLLGGVIDTYGESIIKKARNHSFIHTRIHIHSGYIVDQTEFDKVLDKAHFIYMPVVVNTFMCRNIPEVYGQSKSSGNIADVIKHARPFIAPSTLALPTALQSSCFQYSDIREITDILKQLMNDKSVYLRYQDEAYKNSLEFTLEKIRNQNDAVFL